MDSLVELHARRQFDGMPKSGLPRSGAVGATIVPCGKTWRCKSVVGWLLLAQTAIACWVSCWACCGAALRMLSTTNCSVLRNFWNWLRGAQLEDGDHMIIPRACAAMWLIVLASRFCGDRLNYDVSELFNCCWVYWLPWISSHMLLRDCSFGNFPKSLNTI